MFLIIYAVAFRHLTIGLLLLTILFMVETQLIKLGLSLGLALTESDRATRRKIGRCMIEAVGWRASLGMSTRGRRRALVAVTAPASSNASRFGDMKVREAGSWGIRLQNKAYTQEQWVHAIKYALLDKADAIRRKVHARRA